MIIKKDKVTRKQLIALLDFGSKVSSGILVQAHSTDSKAISLKPAFRLVKCSEDHSFVYDSGEKAHFHESRFSIEIVITDHCLSDRTLPDGGGEFWAEMSTPSAIYIEIARILSTDIVS